MYAELDNAIYELAKTLGGSFARGEHSDAESIREAISRLKKPDDMLESAISLLKRAGESSDCFAPDVNWWREYFTLTGEHVILSNEGWEPGETKAEYLRDDPDWKPLDEVNAPAALEKSELDRCTCGHPKSAHCYDDGQLKPWCDECPCKAFQYPEESTMSDNNIFVTNCPTCNHFPTQRINLDQITAEEGAGTAGYYYQALPDEAAEKGKREALQLLNDTLERAKAEGLELVRISGEHYDFKNVRAERYRAALEDIVRVGNSTNIWLNPAPQQPEAAETARVFLWKELGAINLALENWESQGGTAKAWEKLTAGIEQRLANLLDAHAAHVTAALAEKLERKLKDEFVRGMNAGAATEHELTIEWQQRAEALQAEVQRLREGLNAR